MFTACPPNLRVGIGTENPATTFHTVGSGLFTDRLTVGSSGGNNSSIFSVHSTNETGITLKSQHSSSDGIGILVETDNASTRALSVQDVNFANGNGREVFRVSGQGELRCTRVVVDSDVWPDYVFDPDFELQPLAEVEAFIAENGHLPGVNDRETVIAQGIDVGENSVISLEKIEQLYLYAIAQQKQIDALQQQIQQLTNNAE